MCRSEAAGGADATALLERIRRRECTVEAAIRKCLEGVAARDSEVGAYLSLAGEAALASAVDLDRRLDMGEDPGPLAGLPLAVKDNLTTLGLPTTCASRMLEQWTAPYEAEVVSRLRQAGAILLGKTNMDEFAMGSSCETSALRRTRNPLALDRVPGGSSGGSAAAVAAGFCGAALGSDTGGSVRQPASFCGVVGLRPTYGLVSRHGLVALASSLDQVGPITRSVRDAALLLQVMAGAGVSALDSTARAPGPVGDLVAACGGDAAGLRVGLLSLGQADELPCREASSALDRAAVRLEGLGCHLSQVALPHLDLALSAYHLICAAEVSSNLSRFDGVRFGLPVPEARDHADLVSRARARGFGPEVKRRVLLGAHALSAGYRDDLYERAQAARRLITGDFARLFQRCDLVISPTTPTPAFLLGERAGDPLSMALADAFTAPASLAGLPAISVPCGRTERGLPLGLQVMGPRFSEGTVLTLAAAYERGRTLDEQGGAPGGHPPAEGET